jgi:hypothetical protein
MSSPYEIGLRQLIWAEYRSGVDKEHALANIKSKRISANTIDKWYQHFQSGKTSLFDENKSQYIVMSAIQNLSNKKEVNNILI